VVSKRRGEEGERRRGGGQLERRLTGSTEKTKDEKRKRKRTLSNGRAVKAEIFDRDGVGLDH